MIVNNLFVKNVAYLVFNRLKVIIYKPQQYSTLLL